MPAMKSRSKPLRVPSRSREVSSNSGGLPEHAQPLEAHAFDEIRGLNIEPGYDSQRHEITKSFVSVLTFQRGPALFQSAQALFQLPDMLPPVREETGPQWEFWR